MAAIELGVSKFVGKLRSWIFNSGVFLARKATFGFSFDIYNSAILDLVQLSWQIALGYLGYSLTFSLMISQQQKKNVQAKLGLRD